MTSRKRRYHQIRIRKPFDSYRSIAQGSLDKLLDTNYESEDSKDYKGKNLLNTFIKNFYEESKDIRQEQTADTENNSFVNKEDSHIKNKPVTKKLIPKPKPPKNNLRKPRKLKLTDRTKGNFIKLNKKMTRKVGTMGFGLEKAKQINLSFLNKSKFNL